MMWRWSLAVSTVVMYGLKKKNSKKKLKSILSNANFIQECHSLGWCQAPTLFFNLFIYWFIFQFEKRMLFTFSFFQIFDLFRLERSQQFQRQSIDFNNHIFISNSPECQQPVDWNHPNYIVVFRLPFCFHHAVSVAPFAVIHS